MSGTDALWYPLTVLRPRSQVDKEYGQIVSLAFLYPIPSHGEGGREGSCHRKGGGGGSQVGVLKLDVYGQPYLTIPYTSQGFQNKISDWMQWKTREGAYSAIYLCRSGLCKKIKKFVSLLFPFEGAQAWDIHRRVFYTNQACMGRWLRNKEII